jgi:pSer/pThr/pTyr-binding forkhead associated (FHA) protein
LNLRVLRKFSFAAGGLLGLLGGFVAWVVGEPVWFHAEGVMKTTPLLSQVFGGTPDVLYASALGLYLGFFLGAVEGVLALDARTLARGMLFGSIAGLVGGGVGSALGSLAFEVLGHSWIGRCLGWAVFGGLLGVAPGLVLKAADRAARGLMGGAVGGFIGGMVFLATASLFQQPIYGRMLAIPMLGGILGACYGLAETLMRRAWLTVLSGPSEGYEFALGRRETSIGSGAKADLRLKTDPPMPGLALELKPENGRYQLAKLDLDAATVNQQPIERVWLNDGDVIRVRGVRILFSQKDAAPIKQTVIVAPQVAAAGGGSAGLPPPPSSNPSSLAYLRNEPASLNASGKVVRRFLEGVEGKVAGHRFLLESDRVTIGRDDSNDIVLDDLSVSLRHAEIHKKGKVLVLFDLSSSNGTFVQGRRITENAIKPGFTVEIGQVKFKVIEEA